MNASEEKPVKCVVHVSVYFHEILPTGETGRSISPSFNRSKKIKNRILSFKTKTESVAVQNVLDLLKDIDNLGEKYK